MRAGCSADTSVQVEVAMAAPLPRKWSDAAAATAETEVKAAGLNERKAYVFRLRAKNTLGLSEPGPASLPIIPGDVGAGLHKPPHVEALTSSSFRIAWVDNVPPCLAPVTWRLEYHRASEAAGNWHVLLESTELTAYEPLLRCPGKCSFRVRPLNLDGWDGASAPSEPLATRQLHPPAHGAVRLEIIIRGIAGIPFSEILQQAERDLAEALHVVRQRVHGVEVREASGGTDAYPIVFDLLPTASVHLHSDAKKDGSLWVEADEEALRMAQELAIHLLDTESPLRKSSLFSRIDENAGLLQLNEDGDISHVGAWVPPPSAPPVTETGGLRWALVKLLASLAVVGACVHKVCSSRSTYRYTSVKVSHAEEGGGLLDGRASYLYDGDARGLVGEADIIASSMGALEPVHEIRVEVVHDHLASASGDVPTIAPPPPHDGRIRAAGTVTQAAVPLKEECPGLELADAALRAAASHRPASDNDDSSDDDEGEDNNAGDNDVLVSSSRPRL